MKTYSLQIIGAGDALAAAAHFILGSQFVSVMPLPDDHWEVTVREENAAALITLCHRLILTYLE